MAGKKRQARTPGKHQALILVEGDTEEELYAAIGKRYFRSAAKRIKNLRGNFNINAKIADAATGYAQNNPSNTFDVYVCIDQERIEVPAFNQELVEGALCKVANFKRLVPVIAVLMTESLFFIDIDGLYAFVRARKSRRKPGKYGSSAESVGR